MDSGVISQTILPFLQSILKCYDLLSMAALSFGVQQQLRYTELAKWPNIYQVTVSFVYSKHRFRCKKLNYTAFSIIKSLMKLHDFYINTLM